MGKNKDNAGFTIIELVIVMILIAIISVVGIVSLKAPSDTAIELAARKVSYDIGYVRERAMTTAKSHKIYINTPDRFRAGFGNYTLIINPENQTPFDINLSTKYTGVAFFKNYSVKFDALGVGRFGNVTSIVLTAAGKTKAVKIVPQTGKVYVKD